MNATSPFPFPFPLHWTPRALADAVPLRVHELFAAGATQPRAGNQARIAPRQRPLYAGYRAPVPLPPRFLVG